jgi:hypothetical protein
MNGLRATPGGSDDGRRSPINIILWADICLNSKFVIDNRLLTSFSRRQAFLSLERIDDRRLEEGFDYQRVKLGASTPLNFFNCLTGGHGGPVRSV